MSRVFSITVGGQALRYPVSARGTVVTNPNDPQELPASDPKFNPVKPSASTARACRLHELRRELTSLGSASPRQAEIEAEVAILGPIVNFERERFWNPRPHME
jgi:hypothetical protein